MAKRGLVGLVPTTMAVLFPRLDRLWWYLALVSAIALLGQELARSSAMAGPAEFEGFGEDSDELEDEASSVYPVIVPPPVVTQSGFETDRGPPEEEIKHSKSSEIPNPTETPKSAIKSHSDYWDEDEFEGLPPFEPSPPINTNPSETPEANKGSKKPKNLAPAGPQSYYIEFFCVIFLIAFAVNYFLGRRQNEQIALAWAAQFATKDGIFEKNFSLLGTGDGNDTPLLLKEGQNVFKFYASGRRYCQGLLATMELQSRHDLISRMYNYIVPCKDEVNIEVYMNEDGMDAVVFALARKKAAKSMHKDTRDLQQYASLLTPPSNRKWLSEELVAIAESREVALDLVTDTVLDQVFGEKAFAKYGRGLISLHFTDQNLSGSHRKMLRFKFALPSASNMADMTRLIAIVPYYIDLVGRYKLSTQARAKADSARVKVTQEIYKEQQIARQEAIQRRKEERKKNVEETDTKLSAEAIQRRKEERKKNVEETDTKLSAEAIRRKEEKDRQRQLKKSMPKIKMTRVH